MSRSNPPAQPAFVPPRRPTNPERPLGIPGFTFADLFAPLRLAALHGEFEKWFAAHAPEDHARFAAYRACAGAGMKPEEVSEAFWPRRPTSASSSGSCSAWSRRPRRCVKA